MPESVRQPEQGATITGDALDPDGVRAIARDRVAVAIDAAALTRMAAAQEVVRRAAESGQPVYGVTTGLGSRVTEPVASGPAEVAAEYSLRTIRARATAVGEPLERELVRAAMAVRLNGLCAGGSGAAPGLAEGLAALLNHGVHPAVPRSGSIGSADLCLMAHIGLGLIGEGDAELDGEWMGAGEALRRAGLRPVALGLRDGLAICSSSAVAIGAAALALVDARACLEEAQIAAALSMEGFRANLSPLDPRVVAARPAPGQGWSAAGLRGLLHGGALADAGAPAEAGARADRDGGPRRLQDPLSFRCASQLHGSLHAALEGLAAAVEPELGAAADNPLVVASEAAGPASSDAILPTGNFQSPALALALDATAIAIAQVAHAAAARPARLKETRLSGLPANLAAAGPGRATTRSGVAPLGKTAAALVLEIRHLAAPLAIHSAVTADGVEDDSTGALQAALRLRDQVGRMRLLVALELLVAAQAVDVADVTRLGAGTRAAHRCVRGIVPPLGEDRPLGPEVTRLERALLAGGTLTDRVRAAAGPPG